MEAVPPDPPLAYKAGINTLQILERKAYVRHQKNSRAFRFIPVVDHRPARARFPGHPLLFPGVYCMKRLIYTLFALLILATGYLIGASPADHAAPLTIPKPVELSNTFSTLAKKLEPSVVTITSTEIGRAHV